MRIEWTTSTVSVSDIMKQGRCSRVSYFEKKFQNNLDPSGHYQTEVLDIKLWRVEASEETLDFKQIR